MSKFKYINERSSIFSIILYIKNSFDNYIPNNMNEQLRLSIEQLLSNEKNFSEKGVFDLRILVCFMCGGEIDDVERFFSQLSSRFSLMATNQYGDFSFIINAFLGRSNRRVILSLFL